MPNKKELNEEQTKLYNELKKLSKQANQRIVRLERTFGKDTWATKKLKSKLETEPLQAWTSTGRVRVNKSMTITQMKATIKATKKFLQSETSRVKGVKEVRKRQIETIQKTFKDFEVKNFTYEDAENFYDIFESDDNWVYEYFSPSEFQAIVIDAIDNRDTQNQWISRLENYINISNDLDMVEKAIVLYEKYVQPFI